MTKKVSGKSPKKYMRMLISIPDETYATFVQNVPNGQRSQYIVNLLSANLKPKPMTKIPKSQWSKIGTHIKEKYTQEQIKQMTKDAWNDVD